MGVVSPGDDWTAYTANNANAGAVQSAQTDAGTVTASAYTAARTGTANIAGVAFVAPLCGKVRVHFRCGLSNNTTAFSLVSFQILNGSVIGSGSVVMAATDNNALQHTGTAEEKWDSSDLVTGLTPGASYNAQLMYRAQSGSTMTANRPTISISPEWT